MEIVSNLKTLGLSKYNNPPPLPLPPTIKQKKCEGLGTIFSRGLTQIQCSKCSKSTTVSVLRVMNAHVTQCNSDVTNFLWKQQQQLVGFFLAKLLECCSAW